MIKTWSLRRFFIYWGPVGLWMTVIFVLSARQRIQVSEQYYINFIVFKFLHLVEYAILYGLAWRAVKNSFNPSRINLSWFALMITMLYAGSDEYHQLFVVTREGRFRDVIIDGIGAGLAWILLAKLLPKMPKKLQKLAENWDF